MVTMKNKTRSNSSSRSSSSSGRRIGTATATATTTNAIANEKGFELKINTTNTDDEEEDSSVTGEVLKRLALVKKQRKQQQQQQAQKQMADVGVGSEGSTVHHHQKKNGVTVLVGGGGITPTLISSKNISPLLPSSPERRTSSTKLSATAPSTATATSTPPRAPPTKTKLSPSPNNQNQSRRNRRSRSTPAAVFASSSSSATSASPISGAAGGGGVPAGGGSETGKVPDDASVTVTELQQQQQQKKDNTTKCLMDEARQIVNDRRRNTVQRTIHQRHNTFTHYQLPPATTPQQQQQPRRQLFDEYTAGTTTTPKTAVLATTKRSASLPSSISGNRSVVARYSPSADTFSSAITAKAATIKTTTVEATRPTFTTTMSSRIPTMTPPRQLPPSSVVHHHHAAMMMPNKEGHHHHHPHHLHSGLTPSRRGSRRRPPPFRGSSNSSSRKNNDRRRQTKSSTKGVGDGGDDVTGTDLDDDDDHDDDDDVSTIITYDDDDKYDDERKMMEMKMHTMENDRTPRELIAMGAAIDHLCHGGKVSELTDVVEFEIQNPINGTPLLKQTYEFTTDDHNDGDGDRRSGGGSSSLCGHPLVLDTFRDLSMIDNSDRTSHNSHGRRRRRSQSRSRCSANHRHRRHHRSFNSSDRGVVVDGIRRGGRRTNDDDDDDDNYDDGNESKQNGYDGDDSVTLDTFGSALSPIGRFRTYAGEQTVGSNYIEEPETSLDRTRTYEGDQTVGSHTAETSIVRDRTLEGEQTVGSRTVVSSIVRDRTFETIETIDIDQAYDTNGHPFGRARTFESFSVLADEREIEASKKFEGNDRTDETLDAVELTMEQYREKHEGVLYDRVDASQPPSVMEPLWEAATETEETMRSHSPIILPVSKSFEKVARKYHLRSDDSDDLAASFDNDEIGKDEAASSSDIPVFVYQVSEEEVDKTKIGGCLGNNIVGGFAPVNLAKWPSLLSDPPSLMSETQEPHVEETTIAEENNINDDNRSWSEGYSMAVNGIAQRVQSLISLKTWNDDSFVHADAVKKADSFNKSPTYSGPSLHDTPSKPDNSFSTEETRSESTQPIFRQFPDVSRFSTYDGTGTYVRKLETSYEEPIEVECDNTYDPIDMSFEDSIEALSIEVPMENQPEVSSIPRRQANGHAPTRRSRSFTTTGRESMNVASASTSQTQKDKSRQIVGERERLPSKKQKKKKGFSSLKRVLWPSKATSSKTPSKPKMSRVMLDDSLIRP